MKVRGPLNILSRNYFCISGNKHLVSSKQVFRQYSEVNVKQDNAFVKFGKLFIANRINSKLKNQKTSGTSEGIYSPKVLKMYDAVVWKFNSPALWRLNKNEIYELYKSCVGPNHCEVAVGTGLLLEDYVTDKNTLQHLTISLFDLNKNTLDIAEQRIKQSLISSGKHVKLKTAILDITKPSEIAEVRHSYDSVAANFLLHCLHGDKDKIAAIQSCAALVSQEGCFFGSTLLGGDLNNDTHKAGPAAVKTLQFYNQVGIFGNMKDCMEDLEIALKQVFDEVEIWRIGYCAVWKAKTPKN